MKPAPDFWSELADIINREGFEWLMQPRKAYYTHLLKYEDRSPKLRFVARLMLSALALPLLSLGYVLSRTIGVIFNYREWVQNPLKALFMTLSLALPAMIVQATIGFMPFLGLVTPVIGPMVMLVLAAGLLYLAKKMSQTITDTVTMEGNGLLQAVGLSPKHRLTFGNHVAGLAPEYKNLISNHVENKQKLEMPSGLSHDEYCKTRSNFTREKSLLRAFENLIDADQAGKATLTMATAVTKIDLTLLKNASVEHGKIVLKA